MNKSNKSFYVYIYIISICFPYLYIFAIFLLDQLLENLSLGRIPFSYEMRFITLMIYLICSAVITYSLFKVSTYNIYINILLSIISIVGMVVLFCPFMVIMMIIFGAVRD
jgi:hypothetical protein